jgi:DNA-directed RNA polymerase subunit F
VNRLPRKIVDSKPVTTSEARKILEKANEEELGEFQRRTLDYTAKFSKIPAQKAEKLVKELGEKFQLERKDAIQVVNTMPRYIEELRTILTTKGRIISGAQLEDMLKLVNGFRED